MEIRIEDGSSSKPEELREETMNENAPDPGAAAENMDEPQGASGADCLGEEAAGQEAGAPGCETEDGSDEQAEAGGEDTADEAADEDDENPEEEESGSEEEADESEAGKEGGLKGFFSRNKKKDKKDQLIEDLTDRVKRQMAEFDNFRKRTEKEKASMFDMGARSVVEKILPVVDNFERGLDIAQEHSDDPYVEGMQKIYKQLMTVLDSLDVKVIEAEGKEFDPEFHNAVMQEDSEEFEEGFVCKELQKGYTYRDSVVRHSMVAVAK